MQWAGDEYEIVFEGDATLSGNGNISILDRQFENNRSTIKFKAGHEKDTNLILSEAVKRGKVISFNPALPSMNDIFIRVVETRS